MSTFYQKLTVALTIVENIESLESRIVSLKDEIATAAQEVYDSWEQDDEGLDIEFGSGGICDRISEAISDILITNLEGVELIDYGIEGDDHAAIIVHDGKEAYLVDIPYDVYETGGGYSWKKIEDVQFTANDVIVEPVDIEDVLGGESSENY